MNDVVNSQKVLISFMCTFEKFKSHIYHRRSFCGLQRIDRHISPSGTLHNRAHLRFNSFCPNKQFHI